MGYSNPSGNPSRKGWGVTRREDDAPGRVFTQIGPWGLVPIWILDPAMYLPAYYAAVPEDERRPGDDKPLNASELRVYISLRSFSNEAGYARPFVSTIAGRAKVDKSTAERAISKFRRLGWITTKRQYRDDQSIRRCDYFIRDVCPQPADADPFPPDEDEGVPVDSRVGYPSTHGQGTRESTGAKNTPDEPTKETHQKADQTSPASGGDEDETITEVPDGSTTDASSRITAADLTEARMRDRALFRTLVGEQLTSHGAKWRPAGTHPADTWYRVFQTRATKPIKWPGRFLETISDSYPGGGGVEDWLASQGLEMAPAMANG